MLTKQLHKDQLLWFGLFTALCLVSLWASLHFEQYALAGLPVVLLATAAASINIRGLYYLLLFMLPLSVEFEVGSSLRTDFPSEPLMVGLMIVTVIFMLRNLHKLDWSFFKHPLTIIVALHYAWILVAVVNSPNALVSWKYFLAKSWYITVFFLLSGLILREESTIKKAFWLIFIPLSLVIFQTLFRHALQGFSFDDVNTQMWPFFRNHVTYAAMVTLFFPFITLAMAWYEKGSFKRRLLWWMRIVFLVAIYLSFTRACILALIIAAGAYVLIRWNLLKPVVLLGLAAAVIGVIYLADENRYLAFEPDFEKTIHHDDFDDHMAATVKGQDASSMERLNMWIAGFRMSTEKPIVGHGPGNFFPTYKPYTVTGFHTYLSENEQGLTVHNYFILMLVEQGYIGLGIFFLLTIAIFWVGQNLYNNTEGIDRKLVMAVMLSMVIIYVNLLLSDLVETDKVGSVFFINIALLVNLSLYHHKGLPESASE